MDKIPSVRGEVLNNIRHALQMNQTLCNMHANLTRKQTKTKLTSNKKSKQNLRRIKSRNIDNCSITSNDIARNPERACAIHVET